MKYVKRGALDCFTVVACTKRGALGAYHWVGGAKRGALDCFTVVAGTKRGAMPASYRLTWRRSYACDLFYLGRVGVSA